MWLRWLTFSFASVWLRECREFFRPITERSKAKPKQTRMTFALRLNMSLSFQPITYNTRINNGLVTRLFLRFIKVSSFWCWPLSWVVVVIKLVLVLWHSEKEMHFIIPLRVAFNNLNFLFHYFLFFYRFLCPFQSFRMFCVITFVLYLFL